MNTDDDQDSVLVNTNEEPKTERATTSTDRNDRIKKETTQITDNMSRRATLHDDTSTETIAYSEKLECLLMVLSGYLLNPMKTDSQLLLKNMVKIIQEVPA